MNEINIFKTSCFTSYYCNNNSSNSGKNKPCRKFYYIVKLLKLRGSEEKRD